MFITLTKTQYTHESAIKLASQLFKCRETMTHNDQITDFINIYIYNIMLYMYFVANFPTNRDINVL